MTLTANLRGLFLLLSVWFRQVHANYTTEIYGGNSDDGSGYTSTGDVAPFGASVFLGGFWDLEPEVDGPGTPSRCEQALDNIDQIGGIQKVQFTPTFFWDDVGPLDPPEGFDDSCSGVCVSVCVCVFPFLWKVLHAISQSFVEQICQFDEKIHVYT